MTTIMANLEMPTKLGAASRYAVVSPDKLSVKYTHVSQNSYDVGAVQANKPVPVSGTVHYFEMQVKNAGNEGYLGIGFTPEGYDLTLEPGWRANSIGYHGDDGYIFKGQGKGESFGPTFTTNDVVGAGIDYASNEFFFTKNGVLVGTVSKEINVPLFPTIGLHSLNEEVKVNFGYKPFVHDIKLARYPCPYCHRHEIDGSIGSAYAESWEKLLNEKDRLMEKTESLLKKSLEEKEKEMISMKAVVRALSEKL
ncbi:Ran-binding protein M homolog [Linum perenne]